MKKILLFLLLVIGSFLNAQTTLDEAVDFEVVDVDGNPIHLYEILDRGQAVFIYFFSTECGGCKQTASFIAGAFPAFGCNHHGVVFMEISCDDHDSNLITWREEYGISFPSVSLEGGGDDVFNAYNIRTNPSFVLIKPDHSIAIKEMYPFSVDDVVDELVSHDIQLHDCTYNLCEPPTELNAEVFNGSVVLSWDPDMPVNSYYVYRDDELIANVTDSFFVDATVQELMVYCYNVASVCDYGQVGEKSDDVCVAIPQIDGCSAPLELNAIFDDDQVYLDWQSCTDALFYNIYRNTCLIATVWGNCYVDSDMGEGLEFCYEVSSVCGEGLESHLSNEICVTVGLCESPMRLSAEANDGTAVLHWEPAMSVDSYNIYRDGEMIANVIDTFYVDVTVQEMQEYCYAVASVCDNGRVSEQSDHVCLIIPQSENCAAPLGVNAIISDGKVSLSWQPCDNAVFYRLYRNNELIATVLENNYIDADIGEGLEYCYRVSSVCNEELESVPSDENCVIFHYSNIGKCAEKADFFPNPVSDKVVLNVPDKSIVRVVSINGQLVFNKVVPGGSTVVDLSNVGIGQYIIQIIHGNCISTRRIVVIR